MRTKAKKKAPHDIRLSQNAARQIAKILRKQPAGAKLRVAVSGGGCSGFQYGFSIAARRSKDDAVIVRDGVEVLIRSPSLISKARRLTGWMI